MENKDLGGWLVLNGNSASSYIITAFDNFEDSLHVYYLILPPLSIHGYLLHHKHLDMLQKSTFPASPKQKQGFYIKQFCATRGLLITNNMSKADGIYMFLGGSWIRAAL